MAQTRFVKASQVPAGTRFTRAGVGTVAPLPRRQDPVTQPANYFPALGGLAKIGSMAAGMSPGADTLGAGLGLISTGLSLPNLFRSDASTPRKVLGGASGAVNTVSNLSKLSSAAGGAALPASASGALGTVGGTLGIGSGALGLAEGGGPESAAQIISGVMALMGMGGPAALFALPAIFGALEGPSPSDSVKRDTRRGNEGSAEVESLLGPVAARTLPEFLAHPQLSQAATIADWMNRGGAQDLNLGPTANAARLVDQLRSAQAAGHTIPKWQGPQNLEALSFVGGADPVFGALSQRLGEFGFPGSGTPFVPPLAVDVPGFAPPESGPLTTSRQYMDPARPERPWAPDPLFPINLGNVTRAQLDQYRPAYEGQLAAGGTTAAGFDDWAARQLARNWGLYTDAGTPPVRYTIAG